MWTKLPSCGKPDAAHICNRIGAALEPADIVSLPHGAIIQGAEMIRCIRIWTGPDGHSLFETGHIALPHDERGDLLSAVFGARSVSFRETPSGGAFSPHQAPTLQLVVTLSGTLEFRTASGATFRIGPGDVLLAEDTTGSGHSWRLLDDAPWRRAYVAVGPEVQGLFIKGEDQ
jgi:hypothetical protein